MVIAEVPVKPAVSSFSTIKSENDVDVEVHGTHAKAAHRWRRVKFPSTGDAAFVVSLGLS